MMSNRRQRSMVCGVLVGLSRFTPLSGQVTNSVKEGTRQDRRNPYYRDVSGGTEPSQRRCRI